MARFDFDRLVGPDSMAQRLVVKAAQRVWRVRRAATFGAQAVIIDAEGRVLLVRHGYRPGWHFPGGGVERNEGALAALRREVHEETGVVIDGAPHLFGLYTNFAAFPGDHVALFVVRSFSRPSVPAASFEIREQHFFSRDALPEDIASACRRRLEEIFDGHSRDEAW
jgi:8-oxo-dGTP pyrophosphatase MutT (NUDIX family)